MRSRLILQPEQDGAKPLRVPYGDQLVCVRSRYDERQRQRCKTVALIVEESDWTPPLHPPVAERIVCIRLAFSDEELRRRVMGKGGRWNPQRRVWELPYQQVVALGLVGLIVNDQGIYI